MKIVHAHKYFYLRAGAERYMLELMRLQEEAGDQVAPFAMKYPKNDPSPWENFFVSELQTESGVARGTGAVKQLRRAYWSRESAQKFGGLLDVFQPNIVHLHNIYTHISPSILPQAAMRNVPVVMTVHDYALVSANYSLWNSGKPMNVHRLGILPTAKSRFIKGSYLATLALELVYSLHRLKRSYDRFIDFYIAPSRFVADALVQNRISQEKIRVVPHPVFTDCPDRKTAKDKGYVLYVGRLEDYKGVETLVNAMRAFPGTKLKIAGSGSAESHLRSLSEKMKNVEFLGFVRGSALQEVMRSARVVVVPSLWHEVFGLVVTEAMACGVPVVVSNAGALPELVHDGVSGRVFTAGDVVHLKDVLGDFIVDPAYARSLGEAGREIAQTRFAKEAHMESILEVYKEAQVKK